jgi:hypothetical protein
MSAHRLRRGFRKEIDAVFAEADCMSRCGDPATFDDESARIEALRKELWTVIRSLQKQAKGSTK